MANICSVAALATLNNPLYNKLNEIVGVFVCSSGCEKWYIVFVKSDIEHADRNKKIKSTKFRYVCNTFYFFQDKMAE